MINPRAEAIAAAVARAKELIAARSKPLEKTYGQQRIEEATNALAKRTEFTWNTAQQQAIDLGRSGKSFCLIGAAGTGKTTTLRGLLTSLLADNRLPILEKGTKHLSKGAPGVVLFSYTRRAVRNIARQMPEQLRAHCLTGHKLLEFAPERFEIDDGKGGMKISMRFVPTRHRGNKLPSNLQTVIVDESSMVSTEFMELFYAALVNRSDIQFIFLGDLNQLPPVYGDAILGHMLLELPVVELTEVYRQALLSPIIDLAIQVKDGKMKPENKIILKNTVIETDRGKVTLHPWKNKLDQEEGLFAMQKFLRKWIQTESNPGGKEGNDDKLDFENDVILCPWNKAGTFGNIELNKAIGTELALKHDREVYEIIAGFNKIYYSIGDRILHEKRDAIITRIVRNTRYIGKTPQYHSKGLDYWGYTKTPTQLKIQTNDEIEEMLGAFADMSVEGEDRVHEASHAVYIRYSDAGPEEEDTIISSAGILNQTELAYCMSVHKSQGSEWKRVIFITHSCHAKMLSREMVYTAITRASQELYIFMDPMMLTSSCQKPRIKGDTLEEKLKFFTMKKKEKQATIIEEDE